MSYKANNPIFTTKALRGGRVIDFEGLTQREYFAGLMMQSLVSNPENGMWIKELDPRFTGENFDQVVAVNAVEFADALLAELAKPKP